MPRRIKRLGILVCKRLRGRAPSMLRIGGTTFPRSEVCVVMDGRSRNVSVRRCPACSCPSIAAASSLKTVLGQRVNWLCWRRQRLAAGRAWRSDALSRHSTPALRNLARHSMAPVHVPIARTKVFTSGLGGGEGACLASFPSM